MPPPRESTARRISMSAFGSRGPSMWERLALCEQVWRNVDQDCLAEYEYGNSFWIVQIEQKHWILMMLYWSWQAAVPEQVMCFRPSLSTYWSTAHCVDRYCAFFRRDWQNDLHDFMICHILTVSSQAWLVLLRLRGRLHKLPQPSHPGCELCGKNWKSYSQHSRWPPARTLTSAMRAGTPAILRPPAGTPSAGPLSSTFQMHFNPLQQITTCANIGVVWPFLL